MRKIFTKTILVLLIITVLFILFLFVYNKIMLNKEAVFFNEFSDNIYTVNGHKMHLYTEGNSDTTLIFMAGFGDTCPTYSFKSLYSKLSSKYKIAVIEKAGYGFSENVTDTRNIETIVSENRQLLQKANITPPYIIVPFSLSGLEALYWLQEYPDEIQGIISLEMALPQIYTNEPNYSAIQDIGIKLGFARLPILYNQLYDPIYTTDEWDIVKKCWYKNAYNKTVQTEANKIYENSTKIDFNKLDYSKFILCFMNNETKKVDNDWYNYSLDLSKKFTSNDFYLLNSTHLKMNYEESTFISEKIIEFLNSNI